MTGVLRKKGQKNKNSRDRAAHPAWLDISPAFFYFLEITID
jgi:hypothetical protein